MGSGLYKEWEAVDRLDFDSPKCEQTAGSAGEFKYSHEDWRYWTP